MSKPRRSMGALAVLLAIIVPVAIVQLVASRYPTMIERRVEANKAHERAVQAQAKAQAQQQRRQTETTLEVIMPDGKRMTEAEFSKSFRAPSAERDLKNSP